MFEDFAEELHVRLSHEGGDPGDFQDDVGVGAGPVGVLGHGVRKGGRSWGELDDLRHDPLEPRFLVFEVVGEEGEEGGFRCADRCSVGVEGFSDAVGRDGRGDVDGMR